MRIGLPDCLKLTINQKNGNDATIFWYEIIVKFLWYRWSFWSSVVTGPNFISISLLVLQLWQLSFTGNWPEIWKMEISPPEFCQTSGEPDQLRLPYLAGMSLKKCYWMLQNARVAAFSVSELLKENQQGRGLKLPLHPSPRSGLTNSYRLEILRQGLTKSNRLEILRQAIALKHNKILFCM